MKYKQKKNFCQPVQKQRQEETKKEKLLQSSLHANTNNENYR